MLISLLERCWNFYRKNRSFLFERRSFKINSNNAFISFTFDDFPQSAYAVGGRILKKYRIRGTYYVSFGLMGRASPVGRIFSMEDLRELIADGHELGCHTYDHFDSWEAIPGSFENSIIRNKDALRNIFPDESFKSIAYPKNHPHPQIKRIAGRHYECCRGGGQTFNIGKIDLNLIKSCFIDKINNENKRTLKMLIDRNKKNKGWLVFSTHDVRENHSDFGCKPEFFEEVVEYAVQSGASIFPVHETFTQTMKSAQTRSNV